MFLVVTAVTGVVACLFFGVQGLNAGAAGELERIFALMGLFMAAASVVGLVLDDGRREQEAPLLTRDDKAHLLVASPLVVLMLGVFLLTLVPSIYVMLPVFGVWRVIAQRRPREVPPTPLAPSPAYA